MMTKDEKNKFELAGGIILRSQFNHQKNFWRIYRHTPNGGWEMYKNEPFATKEAAEDIINWYVRQYPGKYVND